MVPTHLLAARAAARRIRPGDAAAARAAVLGALLPDLPYLLRGAGLLARRASWDRFRRAMAYDGSPACWGPDLALHSLLPPAALLACAPLLRGQARTVLAAFAGAWAGHVATDLPVHHSDARPPLWPLMRWRWHAPLSGWDDRRHAGLVTAAEILACALLARRPGSADGAAFRRAFRRDWRHVGTLWPTGPRTALMMADLAAVDHAALIVDAGAGTGALTSAILARARPDAQVHVFEIDDELRAILSDRYGADPRVRIHADAADVGAVLGGALADAMTSALPLTSMGGGDRDRLLGILSAHLAPGGSMCAIQYSRHQERALRRQFGLVRRCRLVRAWPPTTVLYVCRQPRAHAAVPQ